MRRSDLIFGGASQLFYVGTKGSATVFGGSGSDTFFGGAGPDVVHGGTGGSNFLVAGTGGATLFGGGNGDLLFASGTVGQELHAGAGNETLNGVLASGADTLFGGSGAVSILGGASDTFVAGTGSATVDAPLGKNVFVFNDGKAGGSALIQGFASGQDTIDLLGYGKNEVTQALKNQQAAGGSTTITLSDHTTITFAGVSSLSAADFSTIAGAGAGNGDGLVTHGQAARSRRAAMISAISATSRSGIRITDLCGAIGQSPDGSEVSASIARGIGRTAGMDQSRSRGVDDR